MKAKQSTKKKYGQYFTPKVVAEFMVGLADISENSNILEPSCGEGVFLEILLNKGFKNLIAYEIDKELNCKFPFIRFESFVSADIKEKFDLIIGNPPYIRWKNLENELKQELSTNLIWIKYFNSLCDYLYIFILKSIELLKENGQLIFICPEYWMNTTHSVSLRNYMVQNGCFEEIYHFNETPVFDNVSVSIVIFKFVKRKINTKIKVAKFYANQKLTFEILNRLQHQLPLKDAEYLQVSQFQLNERWLLQTDDLKNKLQKIESVCKKPTTLTLLNFFEKEKADFYTIGDICDIGNGLVSGLDKAFQVNGHELNSIEKAATINVIKAKDLMPLLSKNVTKYILIHDRLNETEFKNNYPNSYSHYNRKINYWEWVFLRNFNLFNKTEKRIFVPCKERISHKNYFRFALIEGGIFPTQDVTAIFRKPETKESIEYIAGYLNQSFIFDWLKWNGILKGNIVEFSEKPIASIPFRKINWNNQMEVSIHNSITELISQYLIQKDPKMLNVVKTLFHQLF